MPITCVISSCGNKQENKKKLKKIITKETKTKVAFHR